jgi:PKD repeat protein
VKIVFQDQYPATAYNWSLVGLGSRDEDHFHHRINNGGVTYQSCIGNHSTTAIPAIYPNQDFTIHRYSSSRVKYYKNGVLDWDNSEGGVCSEDVGVWIETRDGQLYVFGVLVYKLPTDSDLDNPVPGTTQDVRSSGFTDVRTDDFAVHLIPDDDDGDSYHWNFGDGETSDEKDPSHIFPHSGCYEVVLTVSKDGVDSETTRTLCFDFIIDFKVGRRIGCNPLTVQFSDQSSGVTEPVTYYWDFGDGETSTEKNPVHVYREKGTYSVTHSVTDAYQTRSITIDACIYSKCVMLLCYLDEIRGETGTVEETEKVNFNILRDWAHQDILTVAFKLLPIIADYYRKQVVVALPSSEAVSFADIAHLAGEVSVTGFSGLSANAYKNGSLMWIGDGAVYYARIKENTASVITLEHGDILPGFSGETVLLTGSSSGATVDLSGLNMAKREEPFWSVLDGSGVPIRKLAIDLAKSIDEAPQYNESIYWHTEGDQLILTVGSGATLPGHILLGIYRNPIKAVLETDCIDLPVEYHNLAQKLTMIRIHTKLENYEMAAQLSAEFNKEFTGIMASAIKSRGIDQATEKK